jgi:hypothetical protein
VALPPIPIQRYLVPDAPPVMPEGFTLVDEKIIGGLPHTVRLDAETSVLVLLPTGLATTWRDADPTAVVATSATELVPAAAAAPGASAPIEEMGDVTRVPARLLVRRSGATDASIPLVLGGPRRSPDGGDAGGMRGVRVEIVLLSWDIRAGSVRGAGDFGSRIAFAWRRADRAVAQFGPLPVNPHVLVRRQNESPAPNVSEERRERTRVLESTVGIRFTAEPEGFRIKRLVKGADIR